MYGGERRRGVRTEGGLLQGSLQVDRGGLGVEVSPRTKEERRYLEGIGTNIELAVVAKVGSLSRVVKRKYLIITS